MTVSNLHFFSPDPLAELFWTDVWHGTVTAHAQDTDSGSADDSDDFLGNDGTIMAEAYTAHVDSIATYTVTNGDQVAEGGGDIGATTHSDLLLTEPFKQADGFAIGDFDNLFVIAGGTSGDLVHVTFELDYSGRLDADADAQGFFSVGLAALLTIEDLFGTLLDSALIEDVKSGTGTSYHQPYTGTLSVTTNLEYDAEYWLYAEADSEVYGATVPEPGTLVLLGLGLAALSRRKRR